MKISKTILCFFLIFALISPVFAEEKPAETKKEHSKKNVKGTAAKTKKASKDLKEKIKKMPAI